MGIAADRANDLKDKPNNLKGRNNSKQERRYEQLKDTGANRCLVDNHLLILCVYNVPAVINSL
jgi:hypothetical protein